MESREIALALQGGGAHGAFTWGVLDRLLRESWLEIKALTGTSAGALNAVALKAGLSAGRPAGKRRRKDLRENARLILSDLWQSLPAMQESPLGAWMGGMRTPPAVARMFEAFTPSAMLEQMSHIVSPYDHQFYQNALAPLVERLDFTAVASTDGPALFIGATNVRTGKIRVFSGAEITRDAVLASACLPTVFRAIEIFDPQTGAIEPYWDGGYSGNPPLFPLYAPEFPRDLVIVHLNPFSRNDLPKTPMEIEDRVNEISFNSALLAELRAIHFVNRLSAQNRLPAGAMKDVLVHLIGDDALMVQLQGESKILPDAALIARLCAAGQAAAERFLAQDAANLGQKASADLAELLR